MKRTLGQTYGRVTATLIAVAAVGSAPGLWAAEPHIEEILVTAQKREQSIIEVPISVNVVDGQKLDDFSISTFEEISEYVPNFMVVDSPGNNQIYIRGIGTESGSLALEQSVTLFVDGIYAGRARQFQQPFLDIERIEVLRGPQGALVGKNTSAGAISIVSRRPTEESEFSIAGEYEFETSSYSTTAIASGRVTERFLGRLVVKHDDIGGYVRNVAKNEDEAAGDRLLVRGTGIIDVSDRVTATLRAEYAKSELDGHPFVTIPINGSFSRNRAADALEYDEQKTTNLGLTLDFELGDFTLTSITSYVELESENFVDSDFTGNPILLASFFDDLTQYSQEVRLISPASERFRYVVGAYYLNREIDIVRQTFWNLGPFVGVTNRRFNEKSDLYSVYGQAEYDLIDAVTLAVSARHTSEDKDGDLVRFNTGVVPPSQLGTPLRDSISESETDFSGTLQWRITDNAMVYLTYAEGSKGGGFAGASADATAEGFVLDAESSRSFELGSKLSLLGGRMFLGLAAFSTTYDDLQVSTFNGFSFSLANAAEAKSRGIELDALWRISDHWRMSAALALLDAEYDSFPNGACIAPNHVIPGCVEDISGADLPFAPDWSGNLDLRYENRIGELNFAADLGLVARGKYYVHPTLFGEARQDAYAKVNLRLELADDRAGWTLALVGKNLTDEDTISYAFETPASAAPGAIPDHNLVTQLVDIGRTVALQASYRF